jgi:CRP/FNR family transcriptional regulator, cyclic AMP receptor protein
LELPVIDSALALDALGRCVLFDRVGEETLAACVARMRVRRFRKDQTVFHQGDPGDALFVIATGSVKVVLPSPDTGESAILVTLGPGDFFGELALLDGEAHSATVITLEPTETLVLGRADFDALFDRDPTMWRALVASLTRELRRLTGHVEALHFLDLRDRLTGQLVALAGTPRADGSARLDRRYTQSELAGMVGGSRESVNRLLADLVGRGLVSFDGDILVIPDPARLTTEARR